MVFLIVNWVSNKIPWHLRFYWKRFKLKLTWASIREIKIFEHLVCLNYLKQIPWYIEFKERANKSGCHLSKLIWRSLLEPWHLTSKMIIPLHNHVSCQPRLSNVHNSRWSLETVVKIVKFWNRNLLSLYRYRLKGQIVNKTKWNLKLD